MDTRGVTVPKRIVDPLDVLLDGHRVWSFNPERDGTATPAGRMVKRHAALRPYLRGVARVVVRPHVGEQVLFDDEIGFGSSTDRVSVTDAAGFQLAVDKGGRMQRGFSDTDGDTKTLIVEAVQRVLHDLREECGPGGVPRLRLPARRGPQRAHDRPRLRRRPGLREHPDPPVRHHPREPRRGPADEEARLADRADERGGLQGLGRPRRRPPVRHRRLSVATSSTTCST